MSDLFSNENQEQVARILVTRDLRDRPFVLNLKNTGYKIEEYDESRGGMLESAIVVSYPGKGKVLDERLPASSFLIIFDADEALERVMSSRCFFLDSRVDAKIQTDLFKAIELLLKKRHDQDLVLKKKREWDDLVLEALSGFDYLVKSLPLHRAGDVEQDEGLADLLDFFVRVLAFKERSVSVTQHRQFWDSLVSTFDDFTIKVSSEGDIPVGFTPWSASEKKVSKYSTLKKMGLAFLVSEFSDQIQTIERQRKEENLWDEALSSIIYPLALISANGDLVANNAAFTQLGVFPADCLKLRPQQKIETKNGVFRVERTRLENNKNDESESLISFLFRNDGGKVHANSSEDLGIISSSIAHELNNPLAGILASLSLLELEDNLTDEFQTTIKDMKQGARRCKELVEIFLGFSRATPRHVGAENAATLAFEKALALSRFRMIESNLRLEIELVSLGSFHRQTNLSILAMLWYLVLGEIMTACSHHHLVTGRSSPVLTGRFVEREMSLELFIDSDFVWSEAVLKSKLLVHLVELAGLSLSFDSGTLLLRDWTLT